MQEFRMREFRMQELEFKQIKSNEFGITCILLNVVSFFCIPAF